MKTLTRRGVVDAAAGLGLHFLHMSEGPFSHDAGQIVFISIYLTLKLHNYSIFNYWYCTCTILYYLCGSIKAVDVYGGKTMIQH